MQVAKDRILFDLKYSSNGNSAKNFHSKEKKYWFIIIKPNQGGLESRDFCNIVAKVIEKYCSKNQIIFEYIENTEFILKLRIQAHGKLFKPLNGLHKLVRVSPFGKGDKVHTSLCKVSILNPEPKFNVQIKEQDLRIDYYKSTGPGGQHKNKTMSAVRIVHVPTGVMVTCDSSRSQHDNRTYAHELLECRLEELWKEKQFKQKEELRKSEQLKESVVLSYYFNHKMIVNEHNGEKTTDLKGFLSGDLKVILKN